MSETPLSDTRFVLGSFPSVAQAEKTLEVAKILSEVNVSVMRASEILLAVDSENKITDYALGVMSDQETTLRDIADITAIINEMKEIEKMVEGAEQ